MVNALQAARESRAAGEDIKLIFDGAGTQWIREFAQRESKYAGLFAGVEDCAAACSYRTDAFGVGDAVKEHGDRLVSDFHGHPSFRKLARMVIR